MQTYFEIQTMGLVVTIKLENEKAAYPFEKYLKSGSGRTEERIRISLQSYGKPRYSIIN